MKNIAAIIPTYNRKDFLVECIEAIIGQTYKVKGVYIVDNHSSDGTKELLQEKGFLNTTINGTKINYIGLDINGGGAMGFSVGMETAYREGGYDAFWMMDDDGLPKNDCLEKLVPHLSRFDYVSPIILKRDKHDELCGPVQGSVAPNILLSLFEKGEKGILRGFTNPFNGGLFSKKLVDVVGFPKKELFIYGDEMNYHQRCLMAGFEPVGIFDAVHYHPAFQDQGYINFLKVVNFKPKEMTMYCSWRNNVYNKKIRFERAPVKTVFQVVGLYVAFMLFFIIKKPSWKWFILFNRAYWCGLFEIWGGQYKYVKK